MWLMKTSLIKREKLNIFKKEKLPYKLTNDHEVNALKYMHERATEKVTINDLQIYLNNNPSLNKISRTGAYILPKKVMKYSYKKSHKIPKNWNQKRNIVNCVRLSIFNIIFKLMAIIQFMLTSFIWISSSTSIYNWSKRGVPSAWAINPDSWSMSFIVAISSMRIEGLMVSTSSITSKSFWLFIKDVKDSSMKANQESKKTWFIFDNSSLHRSQEY